MFTGVMGNMPHWKRGENIPEVCQPGGEVVQKNSPILEIHVELIGEAEAAVVYTEVFLEVGGKPSPPW